MSAQVCAGAGGQPFKSSAEVVRELAGRIQSLEEALVNQKIKNAKEAQSHENFQFAEVQRRDVVEGELRAKNREVNQYRQQIQQQQQRINQLEGLQRQNTLQIQANREEVRALTQQLEQGREQIRLLTELLQVSTDQVKLLESQIEKMSREVLEEVRQLRTPKEEPDIVSTIMKWGAWFFSGPRELIEISQGKHNKT